LGGSTYQLMSLFADGGFMMYPLVLCSLLALGVVIAKGWTLRVAHVDTKMVLGTTSELTKAGKIDEAIELNAETPGPAAAILYAGLRRIRGMRVRRGEVEQIISTTGTIELGFLERGLVVLATIANVAPLMGFLGTVIGMISAFASIEAAGQVDPSLVASGIKISLLTTAAGLAIAIPVNIAYNFFVTRIDTLIVDMEQGAQEVFNLAWDLEADGKLTVTEENLGGSDGGTASGNGSASAGGGAASAVAPMVADAVTEAASDPTGSEGGASGLAIETIEGIGPAFGRRLREAGMPTTLDLLNKCATAASRAEIATACGVEPIAVDGWASAADMLRLGGMSGDSAEILAASGIRKASDLASANAAALATKLVEVNADKHLVVREDLPDAAKIGAWIAQAAGLSGIIQDL
jgi:biopolymer transport protein ExbB